MAGYVISPDGKLFWSENEEKWLPLPLMPHTTVNHNDGNTIIENGTNGGEPIENIIQSSTEKPALISTNAMNTTPTNWIDKFDSVSMTTKKQVIGVFIIVFIVSAGLLFYHKPTYNLTYSVTMISSEEVILSQIYMDPELMIESGSLYYFIDECYDVKTCSYEKVFEFEYTESFDASFTVLAIGSESVDEVDICVSVKLDSKTLDASCYIYFDPNDEKNLGVLTVSHFVNQNEIDKLEWYIQTSVWTHKS